MNHLRRSINSPRPAGSRLAAMLLLMLLAGDLLAQPIALGGDSALAVALQNLTGGNVRMPDRLAPPKREWHSCPFGKFHDEEGEEQDLKKRSVLPPSNAAAHQQLPFLSVRQFAFHRQAEDHRRLPCKNLLPPRKALLKACFSRAGPTPLQN